MPRRTVRRSKPFLVMNMTFSLLCLPLSEMVRNPYLSAPPRVVAAGVALSRMVNCGLWCQSQSTRTCSPWPRSLPDDGPHGRDVLRRHPAAESVGHQLFDDGGNEQPRFLHERAPQRHHAVHLVLSASLLDASIGAPPVPPSTDRHWPTASKFSSASPIGSNSLWQLAHTGLLRCSSSRSRTGSTWPPRVDSSTAARPAAAVEVAR